jgi:hypothetical protein
MNRSDEILDKIVNVSNTLRWVDIEYLCNQNNFIIKPTKKNGYKVYINKSVWCLHLEHRTSNELKHGIIRNLRKVLIKEKIINGK